MASQVPQEPDRAAAAMLAELADLRKRLKAAIHWRDCLAEQLARVDAEIAANARTFATLNGDLVKPTLDQLRRMVADETGKA